MALSNTESLNFGLAAIRLKRNNEIILQDSLIGNVTAEWNATTVATMPAAATYASFYRLGASEGTGTITLADRPLVVDGDIAGGTVTTTAAASSATVGTVSSTNGTTLNSTDLTITAGTVTNNYDFALEATSTSAVTVKWTGDRGEQNEVNVTLSSTATEIRGTGVSIAGPSSPNFTVGDRAEFSVEAPHGGKHQIDIPQIRTGRYYELTVWGAEGGADDSPEKITIPRIFVVGANYAKTAKELPAVELGFQICSPLDGGYVVRREIWEPTD